MALSLALMHWVLLVGWGLLLNDSLGGYQYCRWTMPSLRHPDGVPWAFTLVGILALIVLAFSDHRWLKLPPRYCIYPLLLFLIAQMFSLWLVESNARFPEINW